MKIAFIVPIFYPLEYGAGNATLDFANELIKKNHRISIITPKWDITHKNYEKIKDISVYRINILNTKNIVNISFIIGAIKKIKEINSDIVYAQTIYPAGMVSAISGKLFNKTSIVHARGGDVNEYLNTNNIIKLLCLFSLKFNDFIFTLSLDHKNRLNKYTKKEIFILPNAVKKIKLNKTKEQYKKDFNFEKNKFHILWAGIIRPFKGVIYLINAVRNLDNCVLHIVGEGSPEKFFGKKDFGKNIKFYGRVPRKKVFEFMKAADIGVYPTLRAQGLGNAILEAMYLKLPIIGTNVGFFPEIIKNNYSGLLIKPKDTNALKEAILILKNNKSLREKFAQRSFKLIDEKYNWSNMVGRLGTILNKN